MKLRKGCFEHGLGISSLPQGQVPKWTVGVHNGYWYNKDGERVGFGDIYPQAMITLAENLDEGEVCFILQEQDGMKAGETAGRMIREKCAFVITPFCIYSVLPDDYDLLKRTSWLGAIRIHREHVLTMI